VLRPLIVDSRRIGEHITTEELYFVSADWSKEEKKRSVHVADRRRRCIWREERQVWNLHELLNVARKWARRGSVLVGIDAALGVPASYWQAVEEEQRRGNSSPWADFVDWLSRLHPNSSFFEPVSSLDRWSVDQPFFRVPKGEGNFKAFKNGFNDGLLRGVEQRTKANVMFAVSGIPGVVGWGTASLWKELIPRLAPEREFAVWPFEGRLCDLLSNRGIVVAETYPRLAYGAAIAGSIPTHRIDIDKNKSDARNHACDLLEEALWIQEACVDLGDLDCARANADAFDSLFTAAAVLRCFIERQPLCDPSWIDRVAQGAMLLAGPVDPRKPACKLIVPKGPQSGTNRTAPMGRAATAKRSKYRCPIDGCTKVFRRGRMGWDAHVASRRQHPHWHPELTDPDERKQRFKSEFPDWFRG